MDAKSRMCAAIALFFVGRLVDVVSANGLGVMGRRAPCGNEGEPVRVDSIDRPKCYSCICKNGFVECYSYKICPEIIGCHMLMDKTKDDCCRKCKGCFYNDVHHESNTEWMDPGQPCKVLKCEAGVVTKSEMKCHVPCENPMPPSPGKCCHTCPDCRINGQVASDDRDVTSGDLCVKCICRGGRMTCSKKACPVLQCRREHQIRDPGECCPRCTGMGSKFEVTNRCSLGNELYKEGEYRTIDECTKCRCTNKTSVCERKTCPILNCPTDLQKKRDPNSCCKECKKVEIEEARLQCTMLGKTYEEGQSMSMNACTLCQCHRGQISCSMQRCNVTLPCPYGTRLVRNEGECCEKCEEIESEATCMVFGDPHYKTFDGKMFFFPGLGKFQLVSDCQNHTFSIRTTNDYWNKNQSSSITKRVRIKFGEYRINLGQKLRTRINGQRVEIPHKKLGKLQIEKLESQNMLRITLSNNVKILWNGKSFLEVTVPATYKNKLCGLCGNFNSNVQDDLKMRKGGVLNDTENNLQKFGFSWCVGKDCASQLSRTTKMRPCNMRYHKQRHMEKNPCKYLTSTELFNGCDSKLNYHKYYNACVHDMCDCPDGRCYCESLMAYAQECQRLGVDVKNWQKNSYCMAGTSKKSHAKQKHGKANSKFSRADIEKFSEKLGKKKDRGNEPIIK